MFPKVVDFAIAFEDIQQGASAGQTVNVPYTLKGVVEGDEVLVEAIANGNWIANPVEGKQEIAVTAPDPFVNGKVIVVAANGRGKSDMKALYFSAAEVTVVNATTTTPAVADAGDVTVSVTSNVEYTVSIPAAATWITYNPTKAFTRELTFELEENTGVTRSATISLSIPSLTKACA